MLGPRAKVRKSMKKPRGNKKNKEEKQEKTLSPFPEPVPTATATTLPVPATEWTCPATESMDLPSAITLALSQTTQLPLGNDSSHHSIGSTCRVFWDDEGRWFSARILLYDPRKERYFIHYDEDETTEWVNAGASSVDGVQVVEQVVLYQGYPALVVRINQRAQELLGLQIAPDSFYVEYFQHKQGLAPQYSIAPARALLNKSLRRLWPNPVKPSQRLAFQHAQRELDQIQRIRELVLAACKSRLCSGQYQCPTYLPTGPQTPTQATGPPSSLLLGLRVRTSSCSLAAITALFARTKETAESSVTSGVQLAKCFGTITDYCPGNDEHFVVFDNAAVIAPKWIRIEAGATQSSSNSNSNSNSTNCSSSEHKKDESGGALLEDVGVNMEDVAEREERTRLLVEKDIARRPNDVELLIEWTFPDDDIDATSSCSSSIDNNFNNNDKIKLKESAGGLGKQPKKRRRGGGSTSSGLQLEEKKREEKPQEELETDVDMVKESGGEGKASGEEQGGADAPLLCGLCGLGSFCGLEDSSSQGLDQGQELRLGAVETCSVCNNHHFHRHCMPMSRVALAENQSWRCWHCTCCECCGISAWYRESRLEALDDILLSAAAAPHDNIGQEKNKDKVVLQQVLQQGEPLPPRGLCHACVEMLHTGKGYCSVCYRKYIDDTPLYAPPLSSRSISQEVAQQQVAMSMGVAVAEESQQMVCCDECNEWVHSKCEGIDKGQYESIANGTHPVWGNEYLCPLCRIKIPLAAVTALFDIDKSGIFHFPITTSIASTYFDVIRSPMDLSTMRAKAERGQYKALQATRDDFELMCLNALTFNQTEDEYWTLARLFFNRGVALFSSFKRTTSCSAFGTEVRDLLRAAKHGGGTLQAAEDVRQREKQKSLPKAKKARAKLATAEDPNEYQKSYIVSKRTKIKEGGDEGGNSHSSRGNGGGSSNSFSSYAEMFEDDTTSHKKRKIGQRGELGTISLNSPSPSSCASPQLVGLPTALHKYPHPVASSASASASEALFFLSLQHTLQALLPFVEHVVSTDVAFYGCCKDACSLCASSGSPEHLLMCRECGEAFHSFCVDAPLSLMLQQEARFAALQQGGGGRMGAVPARSRWRCSGCSVTCVVCQLSTCRASPSEPAASTFISCRVCEAITHVGCIPHLSVSGRRLLVEQGRGDESWVCAECCLCGPCQGGGVAEHSVLQRLEKCIGNVFFNGDTAGVLQNKKQQQEQLGRERGRLWGFSTELCVQCATRDLFLHQYLGRSGSSSSSNKCDSSDQVWPLHVQNWAPPFLQINSDVCGACGGGLALKEGKPLQQESVGCICCSLCFQFFHAACCIPNPDSTDSLQPPQGIPFACEACRRSEHALVGGVSHVGRGKEAAELLQCIADIQVLRKKKNKGGNEKVSGTDAGRGNEGKGASAVSREMLRLVGGTAEHERDVLLQVLVAWAARRCFFVERSALVRQSFLATGSTQQQHLGASSPLYPLLHRKRNESVDKEVPARSVQFVRLWKLLEDEGGESSKADKDHKTALLQGGSKLILQQTGEGRARPRDSLVSLASLAVAFLHESSEELGAAISAAVPSQVLQQHGWLAAPPDDMLRPLLSYSQPPPPSLVAGIPPSFHTQTHTPERVLQALKEMFLCLLSPKFKLYSGVRLPCLSGDVTAEQCWQQSPSLLHPSTLRHPLPPPPVLFPQRLPSSPLVLRPSQPQVGGQGQVQSRLLSVKQTLRHPEGTEAGERQKVNQWAVTSTSARPVSVAAVLLNDCVQRQLAAAGPEGETGKKAKGKSVTLNSPPASQPEDQEEAAGTGGRGGAFAHEEMPENFHGCQSGVASMQLLHVNTAALNSVEGADVGHIGGKTEQNNKNDYKEKKKTSKKDSDYFRTRWDSYAQRHLLTPSQRALALALPTELEGVKEAGRPSNPYLLNTCRPMRTELTHGKTGWIVSTNVEGSGEGLLPAVTPPGDTITARIKVASEVPPTLQTVKEKETEWKEEGSAKSVTTLPSDQPSIRWAPVECCTFCHGTEEEESGGDGHLLGRLLPFMGSAGSVAGGVWAHVNCVRSAAGCHEWPSGAVTGAEKARERALETRCALCGETGAAVRCEKKTKTLCTDYFHLKCAIACDFSFTEVKRARMGVQSKLALRDTPRPGGNSSCDFSLLLPPATPTADRKYFVLSACCEAHRLEKQLDQSKKASKTAVAKPTVTRAPPPPDLRALQTPLLRRLQIVEDAYQEDAENFAGFVTAPTSVRSYNRLHTCAGMQHRPLRQQLQLKGGVFSRSSGKEGGVSSSSISKGAKGAMSAEEVYWEYRRRVVDEKLSLLKAGGHGVRVGALTLHSLGCASSALPLHHSADLLLPRGFRSSRIFWSRTHPLTRALYTFEIQAVDASSPSSDPHQQRLLAPRPQFLVAISDEPEHLIVASSIEQCFLQIVEKVRECNAHVWPDMFASLLLGATGGLTGGKRTATLSSAATASFNPTLLVARASSFFGVGLDLVRYALETQAEALAAMAPQLFAEHQHSASSLLPPAYRPRFHLPGVAQLNEVLRRRKQDARKSRKNLHGSARAEGWVAGERLQLGGDESDLEEKEEAKKKQPGAKRKTAGGAEGGGGVGKKKKASARRGDHLADSGEALADCGVGGLEDAGISSEEVARRRARLLRQYQDLSERYQRDPFEKLEVRRSAIHGYGLYARVEVAKDEMVIEYIGEQVRQVVADTREEAYEEAGLGSCYMFRLDKEFIVDATHTGSMARFINHCCEANAYARVISVQPLDDEQSDNAGTSQSHNKPVEKRIVIFAGRTIQPGEEITYDYKFPLEDQKLKCYCGAAQCRGSMN